MERHYFKVKPKKCPICESNNILNIVYGYPGVDLYEDSEAGKVILGGCSQEINDPDWQCADCHTILYKYQR
jgi:hypothetical protein